MRASNYEASCRLEGMLKEEWRQVVGFEGYYEVSNYGQVRSCNRFVNCSRGTKKRLWKGKILSQTIAATRGYLQVSLSMLGKTHKVYVHRLVAEAFLIERGETVNHIDGDKLNNRVDNLEWVSYSDNNRHAFKLGLKLPSGGRNGKATN